MSQDKTFVASSPVSAVTVSPNIVWHSHALDYKRRETANGHPALVIWFTGLSGSGKSTLAGALEQSLFSQGVKTYLLDGDNLRHGLCRDLGFSEADRRENIRRVGEVSKLMVDAGLVVLTAFISPNREERQKVRELMQAGQFIEVYVDTPLDVCESRDPKGLYKKARAGELLNFTGIDAVYEAPEHPDIYLDGSQPVEASLETLLFVLKNEGILPV
ncbi:adenylyl-sulfate kinase [Xenorhabdus nematophila]|uniref:Adenylyl-sulfate kinase n=1 Tax=Xenorhabdus nematophila (strain ATCC 19061 / DSM 3370 / CCUG 14189 / LMG 1036 / NCIMB 9965 / AN6) TaxID=406817 RepID=D3VBP6_XENNA|nr:adenylyl-sulfate kinase [Xenorhabdus nematophila]CEF28840.1 adenosine 5'-phosphosulfate kinase [Xenorhabdus nematophila str. Websteri]AYA42276.1 adenylyl-sulfate kinase [Xenorhabdus nematophila]MBA0021002.1 adenylyl-sulfate kinase [Xenorhabdus nematophila]MCB4425952.1 adenylyl-sulfate kinase [Xenorhabdus nematophila]QNJ36644.1 adenylyl-sulfate kinase [Xenorhabdus nematophila]